MQQYRDYLTVARGLVEPHQQNWLIFWLSTATACALGGAAIIGQALAMTPPNQSLQIVGWVAVIAGGLSYVVAFFFSLYHRRAFRKAHGQSPLHTRLVCQWKNWRLRKTLTDAEWLVGFQIFIGMGTATQLDFATLAQQLASRLSLSDLLRATARLRTLGVLAVRIVEPPDPRALVAPGSMYGAVYFSKRSRSSDSAALGILAHKVKRRTDRLSAPIPTHQYLAFLPALVELERLGTALYRAQEDADIHWDRYSANTRSEALLEPVRLWRERVADALPPDFGSGWDTVGWLFGSNNLLCLTDSMGYLRKTILEVSMASKQKPTADDELMTLDNALRIIMKLPPQEPRTTTTTRTPDSDDLMDVRAEKTSEESPRL